MAPRNIQEIVRLKIRSYRRYGKNGGKMFFCSCGGTRRNLFAFTVKIVNTLIKISSRDDRPSIST